MKRISFFATGDDLVPILTAFESDVAVSYTPCEHHPCVQIPSVHSHLELPDVGIATRASAHACDAYVVLDRSIAVVPREIRRNDGTVVFAIDQLFNPDSIVIRTGGIWANRILLSGEVSTVSDSPAAQALMRRMHKPIRKWWTRVGAFWVGPGAIAMLRAGGRLTMAEQSPASFDLKLG